MKIETLEIKNIVGDHQKGNCENLRHIKALPCLSVVQSVHGYYEIGLDGKTPCATEEGGAFIANAGVTQDIVHHNGSGDYMEAQWVFLQITINNLFAFEDVFDPPTLISSQQGSLLYDLIFAITTTSEICKKYSAAYQLTDLFIAQSTLKNTVHNRMVAQLKKYIDEHYFETITKEDLANVAFCSVPNLYRIFQKYFHLSPHNYMNKVRLEKAAMFLQNGDDSVITIAEKVGFDDPIYFSKLFKEKYHLSPKKYRDATLIVNR